MKRVIVVGPGAAGKPNWTSSSGGRAWLRRRLAAQESWIMNGDLGPYDVLNIRLHAADAIVYPDFSPFRCAWRAIRRSPERADFWKWLLLYCRRTRPVLRQAIAAHAGDAAVYVLPTPARSPAIRREHSPQCSWPALTARADPLMH